MKTTIIKLNKEENWGEKLEELINNLRHDSSTDSMHIHTLVREILFQNNSILQEKIKEMKKEKRKLTTHEQTWYMVDGYNQAINDINNLF